MKYTKYVYKNCLIIQSIKKINCLCSKTRKESISSKAVSNFDRFLITISVGLNKLTKRLLVV